MENIILLVIELVEKKVCLYPNSYKKFMKNDNNNYRLYIIGNINYPITRETESEYHEAQYNLIKRGFSIYNPAETFLRKDLSLKDKHNRNRKNLASCNAIYILNSVISFSNNIEIKIASILNLTIIHQGVDLTISKNKINNRSKYRQI
ncbi:DUF4406 domain-containing protein [Flavobacterium sp.]